MFRRIIALIMFGAALAACGQPGAFSPTAPAIVTPAADSVPSDAAPLPETPRLVVMAHDSFSVSEQVIADFEQATGAEVEFLRAGDTGTALNQAILSKNAPLADVFFGVDNTFLSRALAADIFEPYASPLLETIPSELQLDPSMRLLPVDFGYVTINYDIETLVAEGLEPPATLEQLTGPEWRGKLVVQNPATSSPGLAFLLTTVAYFGDDGETTWRDFWRDLRANDVYVSPDWSDAYYAQFSGSSGNGPRPLVVSYATSPAAEVYFSEGALDEPPTANVLAPGAGFRQIEFVGILKGTANRALAEQFVDYMLQPAFQDDIPLQMFVYPASDAATIPDLFEQFAPVPPQPARLAPEQIEQNRERWINEWTDIVLR
jgi:thiamine transport system substrate-binding protein